MPQHSNIQDIVRAVRKFNYRKLLGTINRLAVKLDHEPGRAKVVQWPGRLGRFTFPQQVVIATHSLAALAKVVLGHGNQWESQTPSAKDVIFLQNQMTNLPSYFTTESHGAETLDQLFFQLSFQQFPFQEKAEWNDLGRTALLYRSVPKVLAREGTSPPSDLEAAAKTIYGMTLGQFIWCGFFVYSHSLNPSSPYMRLPGSLDWVANVPSLWRGDPEDMPTPDTFRRFINIVSKDLQGFKDTIGDLRRQDERVIGVDFMPLPAVPVVKLSPNANTGPDRR